MLPALLLTSLQAQQPAPLWGKAVEAPKQTQGGDMKRAADGSLYIIGNAGTREAADQVTFGGSDVLCSGTVYRGTNVNSRVQMLFLTKLTADGTPLWTVRSDEAEVASNSQWLQPTADGGVACFFTLRHTDKGGDHSPSIIDAAGTAHSLDWTLASATASRYYTGIVAKFAADGSMEWMRQLTLADQPSQGLTPNALAADDEGNLWIGGMLTGTLQLPTADQQTVSIAPAHADGDLLLAKLSSDGYYLTHLQTEGTASRLNLSRLCWQDGTMYLLGFAKGTDGATVALGGKSFTCTSDRESPFMAALRRDMTADWLQLYPSEKGSTLQWCGLDAGRDHLWLTGTAQLALTTAGGKTLSTGDLTRAAMLLKIRRSDGQFVDGYVRQDNQTGYFAAFEGTDGHLYAVNHQGVVMGDYPSGGALWIEQFDPADLTTPTGSWEQLIANATNAQCIAVDAAAGRLFTMTRSKVVPNALCGSEMLVAQQTADYACDVCAFQLPEGIVKPQQPGIDLQPFAGDWYFIAANNGTEVAPGVYRSGNDTIRVTATPATDGTATLLCHADSLYCSTSNVYGADWRMLVETDGEGRHRLGWVLTAEQPAGTREFLEPREQYLENGTYYWATSDEGHRYIYLLGENIDASAFVGMTLWSQWTEGDGSDAATVYSLSNEEHNARKIYAIAAQEIPYGSPAGWIEIWSSPKMTRSLSSDVTAIREIAHDQPANTQCYDLQGRRLHQRPARGLWIESGRLHAIQ